MFCSKYSLFKLKIGSDKCKRFSTNSYDSVYYAQASGIVKQQVESVYFVKEPTLYSKQNNYCEMHTFR